MFDLFKRITIASFVAMALFAMLSVQAFAAEDGYIEISGLGASLTLPSGMSRVSSRSYLPDDAAMAAERKAAEAVSADELALYESMVENDVYLYARSGDESEKLQLWISEDADSRAVGSFWYYDDQEIIDWALADASGGYSVSVQTFNGVKYALQIYQTDALSMGILYTIHDGRRYNVIRYTTDLSVGLEEMSALLAETGEGLTLPVPVAESALELKKAPAVLEAAGCSCEIPTGWGELTGVVADGLLGAFSDLAGNRIYVFAGGSGDAQGSIRAFAGSVGAGTADLEAGECLLGGADGKSLSGHGFRGCAASYGAGTFCLLYIGAEQPLALEDFSAVMESAVLAAAAPEQAPASPWAAVLIACAGAGVLAAALIVRKAAAGRAVKSCKDA